MHPILYRAHIAALAFIGALALIVSIVTPPQAHAAAARHAAVTPCVVAFGGNCGPYLYSGIPMSNGYDTYVSNQNVGGNAGTTQIVTAVSPGNWSVVANDVPYGYTGVQSFTAVGQLTNDWNGTGWGGGGSSDTPMSKLNTLRVTYTETPPTGANDDYEYAPDIWTDEYPNDVMFWADTSPVRCTDNGLNASNILGQDSMFGQNWTVYRYGGPGAEIVFILDGSTSTDPVDSGTCAKQTSGTIHVLAGFDWLASHHILALPTMSQFDTGWEITSAEHAKFSESYYRIYAAAGIQA